MVWFKVDDNLAFHRKTLRAGNAAMGMWVRAGAECAQQLTDGFIPDEMVILLGGHAIARKLVAAELWIKTDGGYQFHQWSEDGRQPTRAQVERERKAAQARKERWKERHQNGEPDAEGTPFRTPSGTEPTRARLPDPTRPDPEVPPRSPNDLNQDSRTARAALGPAQ